MNENSAPYPTDLEGIVAALAYRQGWEFDLGEVDRGQGSAGLTLTITAATEDSYHPGRRRHVLHYFPVPPAAFDHDTWRRWVLDRLIEVETHEACEFFTIDGVKPYAPHHGPGRNPYTIVEVGTEEQVRTRFTGEVLPAAT